MSMDVEKLSRIMQDIRINKRMNEAAIKIQKAWRRCNVRSKFSFVISKYNLCARKIQAQYRVYRRNKLIDRISNHKQIKSSIKI